MTTTAPIRVEYLDHMGSDLTAANAARVSFAKHSSELSPQDERLIGYLARHGHWTPFAHPQLSLRIAAPIFVARQLFKHKVGVTPPDDPVANETSRRYVDAEPEFFCPEVWRGRARNRKQGSAGEIEDQEAARFSWGAVMDEAEDAYRMLLDLGVAPEQARLVLPQATMTEWWWTGSLFAFARICRERLADDAQAETREAAEQIAAHCARLFPVSWAALMGEKDA